MWFASSFMRTEPMDNQRGERDILISFPTLSSHQIPSVLYQYHTDFADMHLLS